MKEKLWELIILHLLRLLHHLIIQWLQVTFYFNYKFEMLVNNNNVLHILHDKWSFCSPSLGERCLLYGRCKIKKQYTTIGIQQYQWNLHAKYIHRRFVFFRPHNVNYIRNASFVSNTFLSNSSPDSMGHEESAKHAMDILFRFSRPYAAMATVSLALNYLSHNYICDI